MYKIKSIRLINFKFFFGEKNIALDRKNALIYGENGSGKSSIYWALHCFLHSTLKPNIDSVRKYFVPISENEESIRNRYAHAHADKKSGIIIKLTHDDYEQYADIDAEISDKIVNTQTNQTIKLMTLSSELINYKVIYNMYLATNKSTIKLFKYFEKNLMEFISFDQSLTTIYGHDIQSNALEWWRYIEKGVVPYKTMTDPRYILFQEHVALFNRKMSDFLQLITEETNRCLTEDFKEQFKISFKYTKAVYNDYKYGEDGKTHGRTRATTPPEIELFVRLEDSGKVASFIKRPHSFLNEARLSAIAIAIRFAILNHRYIEQAPRIMVLDDLLLSLDLGNRNTILKILLNKYAKSYQLIILTHDRAFFDCALNHLSEEERMANWKIYEMYETMDGDKKVPYIVGYMTPLAKAYAYFKGHHCPIDYNACGNNQRQALEEIFKEQFKIYSLKDENNELVKVGTLMLAECIDRAKPMYREIGFETAILDELTIHTRQSLNPSSHHNPQSNFYKGELARTFEIIEILKAHKITALVPTDDIITFTVRCSNGEELHYEVQVLENILIYRKPEDKYFIRLNDKRKYHIIKCNDQDYDHVTHGQDLSELYRDTIQGITTNLHKDPIIEDNILEIFKYKDFSLQNHIDRLNA